MPSDSEKPWNPDDEKLWEWASKMDDVSVNQFGLAIVGIGALFFAYSQVPYPHVRLLIALIGLAGSLILWLHLYATRAEYVQFKEKVKSSRDDFVKRFKDAQSWRKKGVNKILYHPVSRLMTYFMALVSWAWLTIILSRASLVSFSVLAYVSVAILIFTFGLTLYRKYEDITKER